MNLSSDDSSESDNDRVVPKKKTNVKSRTKATIQASTSLSSDSESENEEQTYSNAELLSQILKNLQSVNQDLNVAESEAGTSESLNARKKEIINENGSGLTDEITDLLLKGETGTQKSDKAPVKLVNTEQEEEHAPESYSVPKEGVKITITDPNIIFNARKRKERDLHELLRIKLNQRLRANQIFIHKTGLLCWLSHGFHLNKLANEPEILASSLSLVSTSNYPKGKIATNYLQKLTAWFKKAMYVQETKDRQISKDVLVNVVKTKSAKSWKELVVIFVAICRAMGLKTRLVISLLPPDLKLKQEQLFQTKKEKVQENKAKKEKVQESKTKKEKVSEKEEVTIKTEKPKKKELNAVPVNSPESLRKKNLEARKRAAEVLHGKKKIEEPKRILRTRKLKTVKEEVEPEKETMKSKRKAKIPAKEKVEVMEMEDESSTESESPVDDFSEDDDFREKVGTKKFQASKSCTKGSSLEKYKRNRKLLSSDEDEVHVKQDLEKFENYWAEVYSEQEEKWVCVSLRSGTVGNVTQVYKRAAGPMLYIVSWNADERVKDVTRRYCPKWLTVTRKQRVDEKWWKESLKPWEEVKDALSRAEDDQLLQRELEQPLPKTLSECKGNPLYVIQRHLLKFEALYPPDCVPLGHLPNKERDAIYSRHCVHTLCSRETWIKKARVVKPKQDPYKIVKAMPKYDKFSGQKIKNLPLELFGKWQTDAYVPPVAKDGKVPRNEYGNVDLFKESMLPVGTVHIDLPALNRVAKKLNIDCAPACVGFNFGQRGALPAFSGFVVCSEYEDTLREAWEEEQVRIAQREREKREKRIYDNWKKIIKGLLIRTRLAAKYDFGENRESQEGAKNTRKASGVKRVKEGNKRGSKKVRTD